MSRLSLVTSWTTATFLFCLFSEALWGHSYLNGVLVKSPGRVSGVRSSIQYINFAGMSVCSFICIIFYPIVG